jgi:hypothetical protein
MLSVASPAKKCAPFPVIRFRRISFLRPLQPTDRSRTEHKDLQMERYEVLMNHKFLLSSVHEGVNLELRLEAHNAFNHPLFSMGAPGP